MPFTTKKLKFALNFNKFFSQNIFHLTHRTFLIDWFHRVCHVYTVKFPLLSFHVIFHIDVYHDDETLNIFKPYNEESINQLWSEWKEIYYTFVLSPSDVCVGFFWGYFYILFEQQYNQKLKWTWKHFLWRSRAQNITLIVIIQ